MRSLSFFKNVDDFLIYLCHHKNTIIILTSKLNIHNSPENNKCRSLSDILGCYWLRHHINGHTRIRNTSPSSLDYVCLNQKYNALSDHSEQMANFITTHVNIINKNEYGRPYSQKYQSFHL